MSSPAPQRSRGNPAIGDIVRSVVVMGLIVLAIWAFGLLHTNTPDDPVRDVEYASTATSARQAATYPLLAPASLPKDWRANGVRFTPGGTQPWHLGVLTADDRYIGLEQEKVELDDLLEVHADGATEAGTVEIAGATWQRFDGPKDRITLVQVTPEVTTLVTTSTAPFEDVERYVTLLTAD
ncbi:DUF4245 domain-containing protein [Aeromicrobium sp. Leaf350]|uniref:DUF4245 domain-containing protein n=1 Tax=Aeromicrobium sp. Leaf350 TaxID=2876565 RepID=UPI001E61DCC3|nr:DUF4245 domain-containing protein [Aeromicrobium sp. Leaf350]